MPTQPETQVRRKGISYLTDGDYVRKLREKTGCTQAEFALNWSEKGKTIGHRTITKAESGKEPISQHTLATLADIFSNEKDIKKPIHWHDLVAACEKHLLNVDSRKEEAFDAVSESFPTVTAVTDFTGRTQELADIAANLRSGNAVCITAIKAAGGMGKTQLARKSAEDLAPQFPDGTYLLELDGMTQPKTSIAVMKELIAKCIPGTGLLPDVMAELQPIYLAALGSKKLLLVFDNADDAGQVSPLLKDLPKSVGVIITSRKLISLPNVKRIDLEVMSPIDAVTLLDGIVRQTRSDLTEADLKAIAVLCGHLPLALRVAGTMLRDDKKWTQKRFAKALQDDPLRHLTLGTDEYNVGAILRLSVQQLVILNAEQAERFQMLCVIPGTFAEDAAAAVWDLDEDETFTDLDELHNRSLIEWDEITNHYRLHDLMQPVAREAFPKDHILASNREEVVASAGKRYAEYFTTMFIVLEQGFMKRVVSALVTKVIDKDVVSKDDSIVVSKPVENGIGYQVSEKENLLKRAQMIQNLPAIEKYLRCLPDGGKEKEQFTRELEIGLLSFIDEVFRCVDKNVSANSDQLAWWQGVLSQNGAGEMYWLIALHYALQSDWTAACEYAERARSNYLQYQKSKVAEVDSQLVQWRTKLPTPTA